MKTDSIWFNLFLKFPDIFFELLGLSPELSQRYRFDSVEVKALSFRLDGIFMPLMQSPELPIHFVEVQFQRDQTFYSRFMSEIWLYLRQQQPEQDWQATVLYANRSVESTPNYGLVEYFESGRIQRLYLDEINFADSASVYLGAIELIMASEQQVPELVKTLVDQTRRQINQARDLQDTQTTSSVQNTDAAQRLAEFLRIIEEILVCKLPHCSRAELEAMIGLSDLKQTRVYQEGQQEGRQEGRQEGEANLIIRLLNRRLGPLSETQIGQIRTLSLDNLEQLSEALLDLPDITALEQWLAQDQSVTSQ